MRFIRHSRLRAQQASKPAHAPDNRSAARELSHQPSCARTDLVGRVTPYFAPLFCRIAAYVALTAFSVVGSTAAEVAPLPAGVRMIADVAFLKVGREEKLDIYLPPARWLFDRRLHFVSFLAPRPA